MKKETWILVSNSSMAKIFRIEKNQNLIEIAQLTHPESRLHERDLVSSKPGRDFDSMGSSRHAYEAQHSQKSTEFHLFARHISNFLSSAQSEGKYDKLYIAASPVFLGILRQELSRPINMLIAGEVDKDMTQMAPGEIREN